jgi:hypothetical protein
MHIAGKAILEMVTQGWYVLTAYFGTFILLEIRKYGKRIAMHRVARHALWAASVVVVLHSIVAAAAMIRRSGLFRGYRLRTGDDSHWQPCVPSGLHVRRSSGASGRALVEASMSADWQPLERMLGPSLCVDFMFMGRSEQIHLYKHRDTRRYLNIAPDGTCFRYSAQGYQPIGPEEAIEHVFH